MLEDRDKLEILSVSEKEDNVDLLEFILYWNLTGLNIIAFSFPKVASQFVSLNVYKEIIPLLFMEVLINLTVGFFYNYRFFKKY